jgi:hypothetical protein
MALKYHFILSHGHAFWVPPTAAGVTRPSLTGLYPRHWHASAAAEMFGFVFDGYPNPNLLLEEDCTSTCFNAHLQKVEISRASKRPPVRF